jgi:GNAT superfamily N-acetyltransferase
MTIRHSIESDIPAIVDLLKLSLGESLMPKSEAFWRWKHIDNPFGRSPVLLALDGDMIIGVRAFMRWEWRQGNEIYKAVRAVDTATHPDYQGKGIFRKLTLALVDECKSEGVNFIFNTPNKQSEPGYLRMGWEKFGRLKISLCPVIPFRRGRPPISNDMVEEFSSIEQIKDCNFVFSQRCMIANKSANFLKWRYANNPNISYFIYSNKNEGNWAIFRIKSTVIATEFRICELFLGPSGSLINFWKGIYQIAYETGAKVITFSDSSFKVASLSLQIGPIITLRPLSEDNMNFKSWQPSLGDMEVF